jgi:hypothetical protein
MASAARLLRRADCGFNGAPNTEDVDEAVGGAYCGVLRLDASFPIGLPGAALRQRLRRRGLALGPRPTPAAWARGRHLPCALRRDQPVRRHSVRAAQVQLCGADPEGSYDVVERFRFSIGPASERGRLRRAGWTLALLVAAAATNAQPTATSTFLFINQEQLLTGSAAGKELLAEEERQRDAMRGEARALDASFEAEERRLTEQRKTLPPEEFRKLSDAFDARVVGAAQAGRARHGAGAGV